MISSNPILRLLPFWFFILFFKFGAGLHYALMAPLGARIYPIWVMGLLIGAVCFIQLILDVPAGFILDRYGYRRFLRIAVIIFMAAATVMLFGFSATTLLITLVLSSFGWLFFGPGTDAYLLSHAPAKYAGRIMSVRDTVSSIGIVLATVFLGLILNIPVPLMGLLVLMLLATAFVFILLAPRDTASVHAEKKHPAHHYYVRRRFIHDALRAIKKLNPAAGMLLVQGFSASIFYSSIWFVIPILLDSGLESPIPGVGLAIFDFSIVVLGFLLGRMADKFNQRVLVFSGLLTFAAAASALGFSSNIWFVMIGFIATAGDELSGLTLWAWLDRLDKKHTEDGLIAGVITFFYDLGWTIGPITAGLLYGLIGPELTMTVCAIPILVTWVISIFVFKPMSRIAGEAITPKPHRRRYKS